MIKKLRRKIFYILFGILAIILTGIIAILLIYQFHKNSSADAQALVRYTSSEHGNYKNKNHKLDSRIMVYDDSYYCSITFSSNGEKISFSGTIFDNYTEEELVQTAQSILSTNGDSGTVSHLQYLKQLSGNNTVVFLLDARESFRENSHLIWISLAIWLIGLALIFTACLWLSKKIILPVDEAFSKQKQFISDASHELKTPLAVIKSNADLLTSDYPNNKWVSYIGTEINRMSELLTNLLTLTQLEEESAPVSYTDFNLSQTIMKTALPFESVAFETNIHYQIDLDSNLTFHGIPSEIQQLTAILLDNAIKHTTKDGTVLLSLHKYRSGHCAYQLAVHNTGAPIPPDEMDKIFERFYRVDKSRNRKEGRFGLGLAIAASIVKHHNGHIHVQCQNETTSFIVSL